MREGDKQGMNQELTENPRASSTHLEAVCTGQNQRYSGKRSLTEMRESPGRGIECGHLTDRAERADFKPSVVAFLHYGVDVPHA